MRLRTHQFLDMVANMLSCLLGSVLNKDSSVGWIVI